MPEKYVYRVAQQDLAVADLVRSFKIGSGAEIMDIGISGGAADLVARLYIGNEIMTGLPCSTGLENVVPVQGIDVNTHPLIREIVTKFPVVPLYKVAEGEDLIITSNGAAGVAYVIYREFSGADVPKKTAPGGSENDNRLLISHGEYNALLPVGINETVLNVSLNPVGMSGFPFSPAVVPAKMNMDLLGFVMEAGALIGANTTFTGFRIWKLQEAILERNEAYLDPLLFPYNQDTVDLAPFLLPKPITFGAQEDLKAEIRTVNGGIGAEIAHVRATFFFMQKPIA